MEACLAVEREIEKVLTKFSGINDHTSKTLEELVEHVENLKRELSDVPAPEHSELSAAQILILTQLIKKIKDLVSRVATEHRDLHSTVSKVGKAIDRNFTVDFGAASLEGVFESPERTRIINEVICEHFFRQGMLDIGEALIEEAHLQIDESKKAPFFELNKILEALNNRNLQPALYWAEANRERLRAQHSSLEFKLHRLQFIDLLRQGPEKQSEALSYARKFEPFASNHARELQALMGSLIYIKQGISNSPYAYFMDPIQWQEICDIFTRDACSLLGLSVDSPLSVSISAGCIALPALLNIKQVMQQRQVTGVWTSKDELPIEIDLGPSGRYHSIFACPILRQQSSDTNPPMRLICGHVISKDALNKLANGNKLKCPYCPVEQSPADARLIHF